jgi:hypothetical protein
MQAWRLQIGPAERLADRGGLERVSLTIVFVLWFAASLSALIGVRRRGERHRAARLSALGSMLLAADAVLFFFVALGSGFESVAGNRAWTLGPVAAGVIAAFVLWTLSYLSARNARSSGSRARPARHQGDHQS